MLLLKIARIVADDVNYGMSLRNDIYRLIEDVESQQSDKLIEVSDENN